MEELDLIKEKEMKKEETLSERLAELVRKKLIKNIPLKCGSTKGIKVDKNEKIKIATEPVLGIKLIEDELLWKSRKR